MLYSFTQRAEERHGIREINRLIQASIGLQVNDPESTIRGLYFARFLFPFFMVALWNRETIYIFMLWFVLSFFLLSFYFFLA